MRKLKKIFIALLFFLSLSLNSTAQTKPFTPTQLKTLSDSIYLFFADSSLQKSEIFTLKKVYAYDNQKLIKCIMSKGFTSYPMRKDKIDTLKYIITKQLPTKYKSYRIIVTSNNQDVVKLIPPEFDFSANNSTDRAKIHSQTTPLTITEKSYSLDNSLNNKHLAIWAGHGYYYCVDEFRWKFQRPYLFQTVEDLQTQSFTNHYLIPMLEKSGAVVLTPRERCNNTNEVIADNDSNNNSFLINNGTYKWTQGEDSGFANPNGFYSDGENPFEMGTYLYCKTIDNNDLNNGKEESVIEWRPTFPERGMYAVYVAYKSFPNSTQHATYKVKHLGGESHIYVNQKIGGGTWIYLGTFEFESGKNTNAVVILSNATLKGKAQEIVSSDAIRFGGGLGNTKRRPCDSLLSAKYQNIVVENVASQMPRYAEGARDYLHWAGFPDSLYNINRGADDYNDDLKIRGHWVNQLSGGSVYNPDNKGLGIPIDLSLAIHTDSGIACGDTIVGTLGIFSTESEGKTNYPTQTKRLTSRNLADIIQTVVVDDMRSLYCPLWLRRSLWDKKYAESRIPNTPTAILELLSHQNFADMRLAHDPQVKFSLARAIHKGIAKYLSFRYSQPYVISPLPVRDLSVKFSQNDTKALLEWNSTTDTLEPTAIPTKYMVYTKIDSGAFSNGVLVGTTSYTCDITPGKTYSFCVTAINAGGESFPSETVSISKVPNDKGKVLIINNFTKVSAPEWFLSGDTICAGFLDYGIPYISENSFTGLQYDFNTTSTYIDDYSAGFGSSHTDMQCKEIAGNTFNYPALHGASIAKAGYSFCSCASSSIKEYSGELLEYFAIDIIEGKQKQYRVGGLNSNPLQFKVFPENILNILDIYSGMGGNIIISGSYIGTDVFCMDCNSYTPTERELVCKIFGYSCNAHAHQCEPIIFGAPTISAPEFSQIKVSVSIEPNKEIYSANQMDFLRPYDKSAHTIMRYTNGASAAVLFSGKEHRAVSFGFPLECIILKDERDKIFEKTLDYFTQKVTY